MKISPNIKYSFLASVAVAFIYTSFLSVYSSGGRYYFHPDMYEKLATMPYKEAQELMMQQVPKMTRIESLSNAIHFKEFWFGLLSQWLVYTIICFAACMLFIRMSQFNKSLSDGRA